MATSKAHHMEASIGGDLKHHNAFTVHNVKGRRYYSSIDATILLNGDIVEEIVQIQWTIQEQTMPLFGYNSFVWDEVAKGNRIIQGVFAINFTVPDYLDQLINKTATDATMSFVNTGRDLAQDKHASIPSWAKGFTICVGYGDSTAKDRILGKAPCIFLEDLKIQSAGQSLDTQGQNLVEMYQFIARDIQKSR